MTDRPASLQFSRHRLRRVVGLVLLVLFASQTTAMGQTPCHDAGGAAAAASMDGMPGMPGMSHDRHDASGGSRPAPAPDRPSGCDHTIPAADCGFGIGCVVAVPGAALVVTAPPAAPRIRFPALGELPHTTEFAPDPPPPRN